jgi:hypothetical protein
LKIPQGGVQLEQKLVEDRHSRDDTPFTKLAGSERTCTIHQLTSRGFISVCCDTYKLSQTNGTFLLSVDVERFEVQNGVI